MGYLLSWEWGAFTLPLAAFWIWMIVDCVNREPQANVWLWLIVFLGPVGAATYFLARKVPSISGSRTPAFSLRRLIRESEEKVRYLRNAYHLTTLGGLYLEARKTDRARPLFEEALREEPDSATAQLGLGECMVRGKEFAAAVPLLETSFAKDPTLRLGRGGDLLLICFLELDDTARLRSLFETLRRRDRTHPLEFVEAYLLAADGRRDEARRNLDRTIDDIRHLPRYNYNLEKEWLKRAKALRRRLQGAEEVS